MNPESQARVLHYVARSEEYLSAVQFFTEELGPWKNVVALLAVHASISLTDAMLIALTGSRSRDDDHRTASDLLKRAIESVHRDENKAMGIKSLNWLLSRKTLFAYGDQRLTEDDVKRAAREAQSYQSWAYRIVPELGRIRQEEMR